MSEHAHDARDGVLCLVWFDDRDPIIGYHNKYGWWEQDGAPILNTLSHVTHWTTLAEAKAAPDLRAALNRMLAVGWIDASICQARSNIRIGQASPADRQLVVAADDARAALKLATTP